MSVAVIVASLGRPVSVGALLDRLAMQTQLPSQVIISMESLADAPPDRIYPFEVEKIFGPRGACVQRNRALDRLREDNTFVVFYDDDFIPSRFALSGIERFFTQHPDVAGAHGLVLADGINGPGIAPGEAQHMVDTADEAGEQPAFSILARTHGLYGCNMAYRVSMIQGIRFDESLPLYSWLEDLDFGGRVSHPLVHTDAFKGVHCGEKRGREKSGRRLGYSQICNPVYLLGKKTIPRKIAFKMMLRNFLANHIKLLHSEPWIDRRGRATGNWLAIRDILRGRIDPQRILEL
jgi:hypothetical protein